MADDSFGETFNLPMGNASVRSLTAERTFWEQASLLHAEAHRASEKPMPARYCHGHYHDLARMASSPASERALANTSLQQRVVAHKSVYFRSKVRVRRVLRLFGSVEGSLGAVAQ